MNFKAVYFVSVQSNSKRREGVLGSAEHRQESVGVGRQDAQRQGQHH